jgi:multidrug efflux pump subunit AcrA (membrane-fusion protein)
MSDSTTPESGGTGEPAAPDAAALTAKLAAAEAQLAELSTWRTQQEAQAEESKRKSMTEAQKLEADRAALTAKEKALANRARADVLVKLGVVEKFHGYAPDVDPVDPNGAKALEDWAKANPELVKAPEVKSQPFDLGKSALGQILSGEKKSPLMSAAWASRLLGGK